MTKSNRTAIFVKITLASLAIFCISMWAYYGTTENAFVWDTITYLHHHIFYITYASIDNVIWMFLSLEVANWHPLTWISWAMDYQIYGGLSPWGFHLTSNILHSINAILVFVLTLVLFGLNSDTQKRYPISTNNNALIAAFLAALIWAVHPQHVESVAWVAERKDLLCQLFILLAMLTYVKYVSCDQAKKRRWHYITLGMFLLAIMSKPMAVTFPAILLLLDVYPLRRTNLLPARLPQIKTETYTNLFIEKIPYILLSLFLVVITMQAQTVAMGNIPLDLRLLNAFNSIILYLEKLLIPTGFAAHYPYFIDEGGSITWKTFVPVVAVLGISLATVIAWIKGRPAWLIGWLFYLITLSPVLGLIQVGLQGSADRYTYLPTLPVYLFLGVGLLLLLNRSKLWQKVILVLVIVVASIGLIYKTQQQVLTWKNSYTLWGHSVEQNPKDVKSLHNLGIMQLNHDEYNDAVSTFSKALQVNPLYIRSKAYRALTYLYLDDYTHSITDYSELETQHRSNTKIDIDWNCVGFNTGWAYAHLSEYKNAFNSFEKVEPETQLGSDTSIWLAELKNAMALPIEADRLSELPTFCKWVIQTRYLVKGKRQDAPKE